MRKYKKIQEEISLLFKTIAYLCEDIEDLSNQNEGLKERIKEILILINKLLNSLELDWKKAINIFEQQNKKIDAILEHLKVNLKEEFVNDPNAPKVLKLRCVKKYDKTKKANLR